MKAKVVVSYHSHRQPLPSAEAIGYPGRRRTACWKDMEHLCAGLKASHPRYDVAVGARLWAAPRESKPPKERIVADILEEGENGILSYSNLGREEETAVSER